MSSTGQAVKVSKVKLSACLTCPLCNKLFANATTISECLHTFCRECIYKKLSDEKLKHCPVCKVDLGCSPVEKLRADHSLQDLRSKLFPGEEKSAEAPRYEASATSIPRRKTRSLSSLRANARSAKPAERKVTNSKESDFPSSPKSEKAPDRKKDCSFGILDEVNTHISARKVKAAARNKFLPRELPPTHQPDKVTEDQTKDDDHSQHRTSIETSKSRIQNTSGSDSSQQIVAVKVSVDSDESWKDKEDDMCEPLNSLVEAARKNKSSNKSPMQGNAAISVHVDSNDNDSQVSVKKLSHQNKETGDQTQSDPSKSDSIELRRSQDDIEKTAKFLADLNLPAQPETTSNGDSNNRFSPIWFYLVASQEKEAGEQLPQISSSYLRIKDGSLPVSFIKKYIVKKLGLASESEVEISLRGKPVLPSLQLQNVVEMWLQTKPTNQMIRTYVGSSAQDVVMVLSYGRAH